MDDASVDISDHQALEQFVVDNDDLLELEAKIGRFNIFDALRIDRAEIRHSNFLAWLLDPAESHGQGSLFLKAVLMDLLKRAGEEGLPRALSPVQLDGADLQGVEVRREWHGIDLLITCREPAFVVAIENKVDSGEHNDQLQRYEKIVREQLPRQKAQFVFLTREGDPPDSDMDAALWLPYSYADIHRVLSRVRQANTTGIGDDVGTFLDHYLTLIGTRFMDDPTIDELCQRIYRNHRQALDLILARVGPSQELATAIADLVKTDERWILVSHTRQNIYFAHRGLLEALPPIHVIGRVYGGRPYGDRCWIYFSLTPADTGVTFWAGARQTNDQELRTRVLERLTQRTEEFGFRRRAATLSASRPTLDTRDWLKWSEDDPLAIEEVVTSIKERLDKLNLRLAGVPDALRPIIAAWETERRKEA